ncbi:hypothetical protein [Azospirillum sp. B510]|uniref:hypothetical protein n=1 Tax=Azospirillum sp. (strain B510) TaxID=137722 RepID=UPI0003185C1E|nr:hypothetical protein [Azospirillum sp. B510]
MTARLSHRCTALIDRARAAWLSKPLVRKLAARRSTGRVRGRRRITMELLDLELYRIDIGG